MVVYMILCLNNSIQIRNIIIPLAVSHCILNTFSLSTQCVAEQKFCVGFENVIAHLYLTNSAGVYFTCIGSDFNGLPN